MKTGEQILAQAISEVRHRGLTPPMRKKDKPWPCEICADETQLLIKHLETMGFNISITAIRR